ncbi:MAG: response regulator [Verrucomicrobiota bacterium]
MNSPLQNILASSTILLAEDNNDDAFLMCRAFRKAHLLNPLVRVRNGEEAISYLRGDGVYADRGLHPFPFLLLLDLRMPLADGFDVLRWIRAQPELKILVVVLTFSTREPDVKKAFELGANSFLTKPAGFENLTQLLERLQGYWFMTNVAPDAHPASEFELAP